METPSASQAIAVHVNGIERVTHAAPETPLLYVLRNDFGLAATRFGCGSEQCGTCVVWVDGHPAYACTTQVGSLAGAKVTTLEGLARGHTPHPLQAALLEEQAAQCGYCLPGITMRAAALLAEHPDPREEDVRAALEGHLCRCGSHNRIVRAVLRAAAALREDAR